MSKTLTLVFMCVYRSLYYNQLSGPIPSSLNSIVTNGTYVGLHQMYVLNLFDDMFQVIIQVVS